LQAQLILKAILFTVLMPGVGIVLVPYSILSQSAEIVWPGPSVLSVSVAMLGLLGMATLLQCIWSFALHGKGTLAPLDPPKVLVVRGAYRCTRNPMYVAVVVVLVSEAIFFGSSALLIYAGIGLLIFHLFVLRYEEPHLRRQFGTSYDEYCRAVPRWGITFPPYTPSEGATGRGTP
jgi:protein-S-isoprenylcysteine O-methyltransferase Ste14